MMDMILVVCEGNICRSPMAAGLLKRALPALQVVTAGLTARPGREVDRDALEVMAQVGVDIGAHVSAPLTPALIRSADIVLAMTREQCKRIESANPFSTGKVYRLGHQQQIDIADPFRLGRAATTACLADIQRALTYWLDIIGQPTR